MDIVFALVIGTKRLAASWFRGLAGAHLTPGENLFLAIARHYRHQ